MQTRSKSAVIPSLRSGRTGRLRRTLGMLVIPMAACTVDVPTEVSDTSPGSAALTEAQPDLSAGVDVMRGWMEQQALEMKRDPKLIGAQFERMWQFLSTPDEKPRQAMVAELKASGALDVILAGFAKHSVTDEHLELLRLMFGSQKELNAVTVDAAIEKAGASAQKLLDAAGLGDSSSSSSKLQSSKVYLALTVDEENAVARQCLQAGRETVSFGLRRLGGDARGLADAYDAPTACYEHWSGRALGVFASDPRCSNVGRAIDLGYQTYTSVKKAGMGLSQMLGIAHHRCFTPDTNMRLGTSIVAGLTAVFIVAAQYTTGGRTLTAVRESCLNWQEILDFPGFDEPELRTAYAMCKFVGVSLRCARALTEAAGMDISGAAIAYTSAALAGETFLWVASNKYIRPQWCLRSGAEVFSTSRCENAVDDAPPLATVACSQPGQSESGQCGCALPNWTAGDQGVDQAFSLRPPSFEIVRAQGRWYVAPRSIGDTGEYQTAIGGPTVSQFELNNAIAAAQISRVIAGGSAPEPSDLPLQMTQMRFANIPPDPNGPPNALILRTAHTVSEAAGGGATGVDDSFRKMSKASVKLELPMANCCGPVEREFELSLDTYMNQSLAENPDVPTHAVAGNEAASDVVWGSGQSSSGAFIEASIPGADANARCYINSPLSERRCAEIGGSSTCPRPEDVQWQAAGTELINVAVSGPDLIDYIFGNANDKLRRTAESTRRTGVATTGAVDSMRYRLSEYLPDVGGGVLDIWSTAPSGVTGPAATAWAAARFDEMIASQSSRSPFDFSRIQSLREMRKMTLGGDGPYPFNYLPGHSVDREILSDVPFPANDFVYSVSSAGSTRARSVPTINVTSPLSDRILPKKEVTCTFSPRTPVVTYDPTQTCAQPGRSITYEVGVRAGAFADGANTFAESRMVLPLTCTVDGDRGRCTPARPAGTNLVPVRPRNGNCCPAIIARTRPPSADPQIRHAQTDFCTGPVPQQTRDGSPNHG